MRILTRMIAKEVLFSSFFVLLALVALFAFFDLIRQADEIGTEYSILQAFILTALILPTRCYEVLPIAAMLGSVYTLANLAQSSEFTIMRAAGLSPWRLCMMLMLPGILMVGFSYFIGEYVAPPSQQLSKEFKLDLSGQSFTGRDFRSGIWVRDDKHDDQGNIERVAFVNVGSLKPDVGAFNWEIFLFNNKEELKSVINAEKGTYNRKQGWILENVIEQIIPNVPKDQITPTDIKVKIKHYETMVWGKSLDQNIFGLMMIKPENMSMQDLYHYIEHLKENGQQSGNYEAAFWNKVFYPFAILVMLVLSMPFAYLNARSGGIAIKIFFGIMIGIAFYALNNLFAFMSVMNSAPPVLAALTPSLVMLALATAVMYWVERR